MRTIEVYTTSLKYKTDWHNGNIIKALDYVFLKDSQREWIAENRQRLQSLSTKSEKRFEEVLTQNNIPYETQTYFRINGKGYFLDFYLPTMDMAIEIDGASHTKSKRPYDAKRDTRFNQIGVKTVRIPNEVVWGENPWDVVCRKFLNQYYKDGMKRNRRKKYAAIMR